MFNISVIVFLLVKKNTDSFCSCVNVVHHLKTMKKAFSMLMKFLDFIFLYIYI